MAYERDEEEKKQLCMCWLKRTLLSAMEKTLSKDAPPQVRFPNPVQFSVYILVFYFYFY